MTASSASASLSALCRTLLQALAAMGDDTRIDPADIGLTLPDFKIDGADAGHATDATEATNATDALPSRFQVTALAAASVGAAGAALSALRSTFRGDAARASRHAGAATVDTHLTALWFEGSIVPAGWTLPAAWDPIAGDYRTIDGWIRLHTNAPAHRRAALDVLQLPDTHHVVPSREQVQAVVARWQAAVLEDDIVAAGGCAAQMLSAAQWAAHPQGRAVAAEPLVHWTSLAAIRDPAAGWHAPDAATAQPLAGLRVLDLTRILAGPVATRFLAGFGADVLRIDPPGWDEPSLAPDVTLGKHCARLDLHRAADRRTFETLLAGADVLIHGYRPGALDALGYDAATRAALCPGLIDVSLSAYGHSGPWALRRGFDSLVQMSSGIAEAGMRWAGRDKPFPLPVQALDHATGYLIAATALRGLALRRQTGHGGIATLSLARTALLLNRASPAEAAPTFDVDAPRARRRDVDFSGTLEQTPWGPAHRLHPPLDVSGTPPMQWSLPARALGSDIAVWRSRRP